MFTVSRSFPPSLRCAAAAFAAAAVLAACGGGGPRQGSASVPPHTAVQKSDLKPHHGVARARSHQVHGIDISKWQGEIDWNAVRQAGTQFAFIKATEGGDHLDERFLENWHGAKAAGVPRSAYHFVYWCRPASEQAAWFKRHVPRDPDALPPVLDVEWNSHSRTCPARIDRGLAMEKIRLLLREMEAHTGKRPVIYTDIPFHRDVLAGELRDYQFWLRSVAAEPHERYDNRDWHFWQWTTTGRVPGIRGNVDRNVFQGTYAQWRDWVSQSNNTVARR